MTKEVFSSMVSSCIGLAAFNASKFPVLSLAVNEGLNAQREEAKRRAFEAATGLAWEDRHKLAYNCPNINIIDIRAEIERRLSEIRGTGNG